MSLQTHLDVLAKTALGLAVPDLTKTITFSGEQNHWWNSFVAPADGIVWASTEGTGTNLVELVINDAWGTKTNYAATNRAFLYVTKGSQVVWAAVGTTQVTFAPMKYME